MLHFFPGDADAAGSLTHFEESNPAAQPAHVSSLPLNHFSLSILTAIVLTKPLCISHPDDLSSSYSSFLSFLEVQPLDHIPLKCLSTV